MRNGIITLTGFPFKVTANVLAKVVYGLDSFTLWLDGKRRVGRHRLTPDWVDELPELPGEAGRDWFEPTPGVVQDACPECGSDEWPLSVYDGLRMCPVCKDEAIITDRTFGSTSTRMDALTPARLAELDGQLSLLTDGAYEVSHP